MSQSPHLSAHTVANLRVQAPGDGLRELASGVDALYLSGHGYLSKAFLAQLEGERFFSDRVAVPVPFELGPLTFGLAPHGWGKYRFCLDHETGRIGFASSRRLPSVRIQPRAEFLHSVGPEETVRHFAELVRPFVDGLVLSVARLDLFVDMEGMQLCAQDRSAFVCRGDGCTTYENGNAVTGFTIGSRRTQHVSARLYDKTAEMALKGNDWWELVWSDRHTPGAQVWRIEFEIGRAALSDLELFLPEAVLAAVPSLWAYCAGNWLTLRSQTPDSNRSRCRSTVPVSTDRDDSTTGIEREGGRRQAPDGEGRSKGRALAGRPPRAAGRSLHCAQCGELRPSSALLTMDEVAFRLGTSLRHMRRLVAERRIPIVKVGHLVRFDGHDIEHWVGDHRVDVVVPAAVAIRAAREHRRAG
jgi:excisionase family DNA binding protein